MSEETFVNIATEIQQPYIARVPANAQQPNIRQITVSGSASAQQPSTYQYRSPFIYNNPVSAQEPNIRQARQPFTYARQGQSPSIYQHQSPFTYARQGLQPATYQFQQPYPYIATAQSAETKNAQQPYPYIANARASGFYQHPSPFTYRNPVNGQEPNIENTQQPYPYIATGQQPNIRSNQEPNNRNAQTPFTYSHRSPLTYRNPVNGAQPNIRNSQTPFTYRNPVSAQEPNIRSAQQPYPYIANQQEPNIRNQQEPNIRNQQEPNIRNAQQPYPYIANSQTSFDYQFRSPSTYRNPVNAQQPNIRDARQPSTYGFGSPFTYSVQAQTPYPYNVQTPATTSSRTPAVSRTPYIFDGVDGDDNGDNTTTWGPGNSAAQHTNAQYSQGTTNRTWDTIRSYSGASSGDASASMEFTYKTSGTYANSVEVDWYAVDSAAMGPNYRDHINVHSPIDNSWSIDVKWNSSADHSETTFGGSVKFPYSSNNTSGARAKATWHNIWDGSTATYVQFGWSANTNNSNQNPYAEVRSSQVSIQLRVYKTGETTLYTTNPTSKLINMSAAKGGGAPL